jgi:hypothetical protein
MEVGRILQLKTENRNLKLDGVNPETETRVYEKTGNVSNERVHEKDTDRQPMS